MPQVAMRSLITAHERATRLYQLIEQLFDLTYRLSDRRIEHPTRSRPAPALFDHLAAVLLTLELALHGEDRFGELALRRVVEAKVQASTRAWRLWNARGS